MSKNDGPGAEPPGTSNDGNSAKPDEVTLGYRYNLGESNPSGILFELGRLAGYATDPGNPNSMSEKDANSRRALKLAGELVGPLIQWAINHQAGQVIRDIGPAVEWRLHRQVDDKLKERTTRRNLAANDHDNERIGASYKGGDPKIDRRLATRVLGLIASGMNFRQGKHLAGALDGLDKGETDQMLRPVRSWRKHQPASFDQVRLAALQFVEYRRGLGMKEEEAFDEVACAMGCTSDALKQWERRIPKTMDADYVLEHLKLSRICGILVAALTDELRRSELSLFQPKLDFDDPDTRERINKHAVTYGTEKLELVARKFRELENTVKRNRKAKSKG
jgi:hypothetical protein